MEFKVALRVTHYWEHLMERLFVPQTGTDRDSAARWAPALGKPHPLWAICLPAEFSSRTGPSSIQCGALPGTQLIDRIQWLTVQV